MGIAGESLVRGGIGVPRVRGAAEETEGDGTAADRGGFSDWGACSSEWVQIVDAGCRIVLRFVSEADYRDGVKEEKLGAEGAEQRGAEKPPFA